MEKYYKPEIEDIHVGYECEVAHLHEENWTPMMVRHQEETEDFIRAVFNYNRRVRTPYLTRDQILADGWREIHSREYLKIDKHGRTIHFSNGIPESEYDEEYLSVFKVHNKQNILFQGFCKSINEFRKLRELLNIE